MASKHRIETYEWDDGRVDLVFTWAKRPMREEEALVREAMRTLGRIVNGEEVVAFFDYVISTGEDRLNVCPARLGVPVGASMSLPRPSSPQ